MAGRSMSKIKSKYLKITLSDEMINNRRLIINIRVKNYTPTEIQQIRMPIATPASSNLLYKKFPCLSF